MLLSCIVCFNVEMYPVLIIVVVTNCCLQKRCVDLHSFKFKMCLGRSNYNRKWTSIDTFHFINLANAQNSSKAEINRKTFLCKEQGTVCDYQTNTSVNYLRDASWLLKAFAETVWNAFDNTSDRWSVVV